MSKCLSGSRSGFSLLELMVTITVIAVLAIIATPSYNKYLIRSKVSSMVGISSAAKLAVVNDYFNQNNDLTSIDYTANSAPFLTTDADYISSITITNGVILITGNATNLGGRAINVQLTPTVENNKFTWTCEVTTAYLEFAPQECQTGF